jgi:hypothetical protein
MERENKSRQPGEQNIGSIPVGIDVLVKKASVDPKFRQILLEKRGEAARKIDLELTESEKNMLSSISAEQLEKIIENTKVKPEHRAIFLGNVGKLMLVVVISVAVIGVTVPSLGHRIDRETLEQIRKTQIEQLSDADDVNEPNETDIDGSNKDS